MVILSNLTVGFAFAQEPATSVVNETEKKTNVEIKNDIQKLEKLNYEKTRKDSFIKERN